MIKPRRFDPSRATVGVFSPAGPDAVRFPGRFRRALAGIESLGWRVRFAPGTEVAVTQSAAKRAADLHALLLDSEVGLLMAMTGGYGSNEILDHLDMDLLRMQAKPKIGRASCRERV